MTDMVLKSLVSRIGHLHARFRRSASADDLLRQAANSIPIGFVMFNASKQLMLTNDTFVDMYGMSPDCIRPGTTLNQMLRRRFQHLGLTERELAERVAAIEARVDEQTPHCRIDVLPDGRRISVAHKPLPCGGWVGTHEDVTERQLTAEKLHYLAHHDTLTGLKNRAFFWDELGRCVGPSDAAHKDFALHLVDLDLFKRVNDRLGHHVGDKVLREVATRLSDSVGGVDMVARLGGDEFAIIQRREAITRDAAATLGQRVIARLSEEMRLAGERVRIGASVGIAMGPDASADAVELVNRADRAMYAAKGAGRNQLRFCGAGR